MNNETDVSIRFKNSVTGEKKLKEYAETLSKIKSFMNSFDAGASKQLQNSAKDTKQIKDDVSTMSHITKLAFNYTTVREFSRMLNRTATEMARLINKSMDYLENINLYQVAFDGNYKSADKFIGKMTEMYGLDESWLTRTVGIFKQLSNAMNVSTETGEKLSTLLTQMSLDISSLYNVDMERASSVLQSAMAGQTKPIRGLTGGDITQSTLQTTLDTMGIERAVSELSFAEKRLLIVISLTQQLNESIGDMGRTIESPANQMRVLNSQWERFSRALGNVFLPVVTEILPYLNATMMVLTEIINLVAGLFGYNEDDFDYFAGTSDSAIELEESLNGASASAEKLKRGLRGFDKLNVINTPTSASSSIGGIDSDILDAFNSAFDDYQNKLDDVQMKATKIRDAILDWLGFSDGTYKNLKLIAGVLGLIVGFKLLKGLTGLITGTSKLGKLLGTGGLYKTLKKLIEPIKVLGAKDGLAYILLNIKDNIINLLPFIKRLGGAFSVLDGGVGILNQFKDASDGLDTSTGKVALNVTEIVGGGALIGSTFGPVGAIIGALAGGFISLGIAIYGSHKALQQMVEANLFGSLSVSYEQWLDMLNSGAEPITNYKTKYDELQSTLKSLSEEFNSASEVVDLYGYKFGLTSAKITKEDTQNMIDSIEKMCNSTSQMIEENTNFSLTMWGDSFSKMSTLTEEEEKNILNSIYSGGQSQQKELKTAQDNITTTYNNAIKTRGYLTDEEYNYIETQLAKIRKITQAEMSKNQTEIEFFKRQAEQNNLKLDKESYKAFNNALNEYYSEQKEIISSNYNTQLNDAQKNYEQGLINYEQYQSLLKTADEQRVKDSQELNEKVKQYQIDVYQNLADTYANVQGLTDDVSEETRKQIEDIFKGINVDGSDIVRQFSSIGHQASSGMLYALKQDLANKKINLNIGSTYTDPFEQKPYNSNFKMVTSITPYANGGLPPVGQLFVANERGPELIGNIGGQSFVANQNQMMDLLDRKIGNSQSNKPQVFNIYLDEDHKLGTYTLEQLQEMSKTNGKPLFG